MGCAGRRNGRTGACAAGWKNGFLVLVMVLSKMGRVLLALTEQESCMEADDSVIYFLFPNENVPS